jgi:TusA-related sulfurtransferase/DNA-binding transcriptional ArsR family regulator
MADTPDRLESPVPAAAPPLTERRIARRPVVSVARALGSSTRSAIFEHLQSAGAPQTVRDIAGAFDLHPNVARTHLETLADAGLVTVGRRKHPGGGRPAKVYAPRSESAVVVEEAREHSDTAAAGLLVRLLVGLLDAQGASGAARSAAPSTAARAHEVGVAEGRRLVARLPGRDPSAEPSMEDAARTALTALRTHAPDARIVRSGPEWVDIEGVRGMLALLDEIRPALAEPLERGLLAGALAAAGVPASLTETPGASGQGVTLRARAIAVTGRAAAPIPAGTVDARGGQREAGVVRAMRAVTSLRAGDVLEVLAEGPGSPAAFARWADRAGHELLGVERAVDQTGRPAIRLLIRKGA